ncbi:uncharacterized protein JN550_004211 [Neoarthrinium moseri]|uniref:uncharacterized protein n=1 Tax=Neoarthrinium moseri TaxID=1658444 RepID=UPI001FDE4C8F|nr:uncharacterized protein JN550_004211 [Neoarthrinium moseri]KAI1872008.1 hypothetical protein JN550_004211 [Neoarthrinium moseri]
MDTSVYSVQYWSHAHAPRITATAVNKMLYRGLMSYSTTIAPEEVPQGTLLVPEKAEQMQQAQERHPFERAAFPTSRRVVRREISTYTSVPRETVDEFWKNAKVNLGPLVPEDLKDEIKRVCFTYKDLFATKLEDIPPTDLYVHRVRMRDDAKPFQSKRKSWTTPQKYWLDKLLQEGIDAGMYESTMAANGKLSDWSSQPVLVAKDRDAEHPDPWEEPRLTFNFRKIEEEMPGTFIPLLADIHKDLSDPRIGSYSSFDLKHGYWCIPIHPLDRHYFAFDVEGFPQMQPTRMPQGSRTSPYSFKELMDTVTGSIPAPFPEPSLTARTNPHDLRKLLKYMDDIFVMHVDFREQWSFIRDELFPRLAWAGLRLSLKKMFLGYDEVLAVGVTHKIGGRIAVKKVRSEKLREWPVPTDQTGVRAFLGAIGPTRRWIKNFSEIGRPLARLTGNVSFSWGAAEATSFSILKEKAADTVDMHGHDGELPVKAYSDASGYGAGFLVTQIQRDVPKPILYDSFLFTKTQRNYGTYKRELCAIVEFVRRHVTYFQATAQSIIYTDHKPLTFFIDSPNVEGIYARWAGELQVVNVRLEYVSGEKNRVADALSRTIFASEDCQEEPKLTEMGCVSPEGEWVWKDGPGGYERLLKAMEKPVHPQEGMSAEAKFMSIWRWSDDVSEEQNWRALRGHHDLQGMFLSTAMTQPEVDPENGSSTERYEREPWYHDVYQYLKDGRLPRWDRIRNQCIRDRAKAFRLSGNRLEHHRGGIWRTCICRKDVAAVLRKAHDQGGHFSPSITLQRLNQVVYWPSMASDMKEHYLGCVECGWFGPAKPGAPPQPISVWEPNQVLAMDFVGPFPEAQGYKYACVIVCYFSRYSWGFPTISQGTEEAREAFRRWRESTGTIPVVVYVDPGSAFVSEEFHQDMRRQKVEVINAPAKAHKAVGLVEVTNRIFQSILNKTLGGNGEDREWPSKLPEVFREMNSRQMRTMGWSPFEIMHGYLPRGALEAAFPPNSHVEVRRAAEMMELPEKEDLEQAILNHMARVQYCRETVFTEREAERIIRKHRHDVRRPAIAPGDLVFTFQEGKPPKMVAKWRGPFRVKERVGRASFKLENLDGTGMRHSRYDYHEDSLKLFVPRKGYLRQPDDLVLPLNQNLRRPRKRRTRR